MSLQSTENEFLKIINDNTAWMEDASATVANTISLLAPFKKLDNETDLTFAARLKNSFDEALDGEDIEQVETGIEIPDLPDSAPTSTTAARGKLV